jgi:hypothetical protein
MNEYNNPSFATMERRIVVLIHCYMRNRMHSPNINLNQGWVPSFFEIQIMEEIIFKNKSITSALNISWSRIRQLPLIFKHQSTLYPRKLALTSWTSGGRSVSIVHSRTEAMEFIFRNCVLIRIGCITGSLTFYSLIRFLNRSKQPNICI